MWLLVAMAWNSAKANDAFVNCVGCTMPHGWCCKGNVRPMPGWVLRRRWLQRRKLAANLITQRPVGWALSPVSGERFWRALRFGGAGFAVAWLLAQL